MKYSKLTGALTALIVLALSPFFSVANTNGFSPVNDTSRRIVNIVNFIRQSEPRDAAITETVLFETVHEQIKLMAKYKLPGSFLLQYDALINPRYQQLLKNELSSDSEIGAWWEITQPHAEAAGLKWRGRYSWDWHANVGFATGYSPAEREKLVDVYMEKFKSIFGNYPTAVSSWFIDEHTLGYMYDKYHIVASGNCKDQVGTDGYTMWGGYWNQAYYPSRVNSYMPAQNAASQIGVPIFRMLGSDPIYQYESGVGTEMSHVITLEPVYEKGGGDRTWVEWFLKSLANEACLSFAYTQAGQENSFTWERMKTGLEIQFPLIDSLRNAGKVKVETLSESGKWFKNTFAVTPATAVTAFDDYRNEGHKTVWYDSRFYRSNILWSNDSLRIRDIYLFDEKFASPYLKEAGTSTQCIFKALPVIDAFAWSKPDALAGLRIMKTDADGKTVEVMSKNPTVKELAGNKLLIEWNDGVGQKFILLFDEDHISINSNAAPTSKWVLEFRSAPGIKLPFTSFTKQKITAVLDGFEYAITLDKGSIEKGGRGNNYMYRIIPVNNEVVINCGKR
jgi:hypothetical protein